MNTINITKKYRTIHSIKDVHVNMIKEDIERENSKVILDYGCHLGHLSIELALNYDVKIYAVDNFVGTVNDIKMENTIKKITGGNNFFDLMKHNIDECAEYGYKGEIVMMYSEEFMNSTIDDIDLAYIDSSHRPEEYLEFEKILDKIKVGGIISGHDWGFSGVRKGYALIKPRCEPLYIKNNNWCMRKIM